MLVDYIEESTLCNGKLGEYYKLLFRVNHEEINNSHKIKLRLRITRIKNVSNPELDTSIDLKDNQVTAIIRIADRVLAKKSIPINFSNDSTSNIVLLDYEYEINNDYPLVMDYVGEILISNDDSNYIDDTSVKSILFLRAMNTKKLFVDYTVEDNNNTVKFRISPNIEPEFVEYKIDGNPWIRLESYNTPLPIYKTYTNQFIQFRGRYDNKYSYSQAYQIEPRPILTDD